MFQFNLTNVRKNQSRRFLNLNLNLHVNELIMYYLQKNRLSRTIKINADMYIIDFSSRNILFTIKFKMLFSGFHL